MLLNVSPLNNYIFEELNHYVLYVQINAFGNSLVKKLKF